MVKKTYNTISSDAFGVTTGRLSMVRVGLAISVFVFAVASGCVDNEQSFYIEHVKSPPDPPECTVSVGDAVAPSVPLDLSLANAPSMFYLGTNALISREDYGNLRSESNGIMVDGYELYTMDPLQGIVGGTEYFNYNHYMPPESSELLHATLITSGAIDALRASYGCTELSYANVGEAVFYSGLREYFLMDGAPDTPGWVNTGFAANQATINALANTAAVNDSLPGTIYSVVRFLGHTQGDKEVETPEFTFAIQPYCGPAGGWTPCLQNICYAFCTDDAAFPATCSVGLHPQMACADYLTGFSFTIPVASIDPNTDNQVYENVDVCEYLDCP
jgi:hypothetical protein